MDLGIIMSWWTVIAMVFFVGIVLWAWSGRRKKAFDEASRIPLENDDQVTHSDMNLKESDNV